MDPLRVPAITKGNMVAGRGTAAAAAPLRVSRARPWRVEDPEASVASSLPRLRAQCLGSYATKGRRVNGGGRSRMELEIDGKDALSVSLVYEGSHVVDRVFRFQEPVVDAALASFGRRECLPNSSRHRSDPHEGAADARPFGDNRLFVCILSRADYLWVYAPDGETYELSLPFQADRVIPLTSALGGGLLLQRRPLASAPSAAAMAAAFSPSHTKSKADAVSSHITGARYFSLRHPLEEVTPIALASTPLTAPHQFASPAKHFRKTQLLSDPALELVDMCVLPRSLDDDLEDRKDSRALLVCYHRFEWRFLIYEISRYIDDLRLGQSDEDCDRENYPQSETTTGMARSPAAAFVSPAKARQQQCEVSLMEQRYKSHISPDWAARLVWATPSLDVVADRSSERNAIGKPARHCQRAFLALGDISDDHHCANYLNDEETRFQLWIVDERVGVVLVKPVSALSPELKIRDREDNLQVIRCQNAVPLIDEEGNQLDIEVATDVLLTSHNSKRLLLHKAGRIVAEVLTSRHGLFRLFGCAGRRETFAVTQRNDIGRVECRRYAHPLQIVSPLLSSTFRVIHHALPAREYVKLRVATQGLASRLLSQELSSEDTQWRAFQTVLHATILRMIGSIGNDSVEHGASKKARATVTEEFVDAPSDLVASVLESEFALAYNIQRSDVLSTLSISSLSTTSPSHFKNRKTQSESALDGVDLSEMALGDLITALHLLHEDFRLSNGCTAAAISLAQLLYDLSTNLGLLQMSSYYRRLYDSLRSWRLSTPSSPMRLNVRLSFEEFSGIPDLFLWIRERLQSLIPDTSFLEDCGGFDTVTSQVTTQAFPRLECANAWKRSVAIDHYPLWRSEVVCRVCELLFTGDDDQLDMQGVGRNRINRVTELVDYLATDPMGSRLSFEDLPTGIRYILMEAVRVCRENPPPDVSDRVAESIGRRDLVSHYQSGEIRLKIENSSARSHSLEVATRQRSGVMSASGGAHYDSPSAREIPDGLSDVVSQCQRLFPNDQRLKEVARLLRSSRPMCLRLEKTSDMTDQDYIAQQQARLFLLCTRSLALGVARGMVTIGAFDVSTVQNRAWKLDAPGLPLTGRTPPTNATVQLDVSAFPKEMTHWPHFHNGCATGLRLPAKDLSGIVTSSWVKFHRPSRNGSHLTRYQQASSTSPARDTEEAKANHAGMLLGLGLNGHLKCLTMADVYRYLHNDMNEYVSVAIFLGMATAAARSRRKKAVFSSTALLSVRRLRRIGVPGTAPDAATQDFGHFPTASQPIDGDDNADTNVSGSATQDAQADKRQSKAPGVATAVTEVSLQRSISNLLALHIGVQLDYAVPQSARVAALLALGILHQGTGKRAAAEALLAEITRSPASPIFVSQHHSPPGSVPATSSSALERHEGYSLAAALGLGLVMLGRGGSTAGDPSLADIKLEEKLHKYIVGGAVQRVDYGGNESGSSASYLYRGRKWDPVVSGLEGLHIRSSESGGSNFNNVGSDRGSWRGEYVNIGVTASGSALALAFMYLKSGNKSIANLLAVPDTLVLLDNVRPDILLIRALAKNLVLWDWIEPTSSWIENSEVPQQLRDAYKVLQHRSGDADEALPSLPSLPDHADIRSICESYANIVAGACFSIGLRFAGTGDTSARDTLHRYVIHFREMRSRSALLGHDVIAAATERVTIERCLSVCAQSLALVDAGSGNLETLTLLRSINLRQRADSELTYGNHMTLSMAIGLLFLGGGRGTVSRSKDAIAALVISLYPVSSTKPGDNTYYLEAFRHLYTQAVDFSRYVETIDVTSGEPCSIELRVESRREGANRTTVKATSFLKTPCLFPEFDTIDRITIDHPTYYPVDIRLGDEDDMEVDDQNGYDCQSVHMDSPGTVGNDNRIKVLLESSKILLERRPLSTRTPMASVSALPTRRLGHNFARDRSGKDFLVELLYEYFSTSFAKRYNSTIRLVPGGDDGVISWWTQRFQDQSIRLLPARLLPTHLNVLFEVSSIYHPRRKLSSLVSVWNLKLILEFQRVDPFRSLEYSSSSATATRDTARVDFVEWLHSQTEEALRQRWRNEASASFASLSEIQEALLGENDDDVDKEHLFSSSLAADSVLLAAFFVFFDAPPTVYSDTVEWKRRMHHAVQAGTLSTRSKAKFIIDRFLSLRPQDQTTKEEQAFLLRVVSCFLFSV